MLGASVDGGEETASRRKEAWYFGRACAREAELGVVVLRADVDGDVCDGI